MVIKKNVVETTKESPAKGAGCALTSKKPPCPVEKSDLEPNSAQEAEAWDPRWRIAFRLTEVLGEKESLAWFRKAVTLFRSEHILLALLETLAINQERPINSKGAYFTGVLKNYARGTNK